MGKRKWVPEVLWKLFNNKARTLSETIVSLIPQHCDCNARGKCLRCVFGDGDEAAMSYLIRPDDPNDYQLLMEKCFVVVPLEAPPLPALLSFSLRWSQLQIVERTIQTFLSKPAVTSNVICSGYQKFKLSSSIVKLLSCSTWDLTLERVGDSLMGYLLMNTLIFIPISPNAHQQVAGVPVNGLFTRFPFHLPIRDSESSLHARYRRKRRRSNESASLCEEHLCNAPVKAGQQRSSDCGGSRNKDCVGTHASEVSNLLYLTEATKLSNDSGPHRDALLEEESIENNKMNPRKRLRLPSWQRRKRRKTLLQQDTSTQETSTKMPLLCPCCSALQSLSPVPKDAQIKRKSMFYSMRTSSSLFLKKHVLYSFSSGYAGANDLLQHILGLSSTDTISQPASCFHNHGLCSNGSPCL